MPRCADSRSTRCEAPRSTTQSSSRRELLASDVHQSRVLVLVTDGQEVSSKASLDEAIAAANDARVTVYPIANRKPELQAGTAQAARR